ncbi:MAG: hypothetical protein R3E32_05575 [Chitinophagales bacterium]
MTDAHNCTDTAEATVSEPDQLTINLVGVDILCFGENTGEITSSSTGGVGGNEYLWSNINGGNDGTVGVSATGGTPNYTDAHNCTDTAEATVSEPDQLQIGASVVDVLCFGDNTGTVTTLVSGGVIPYTYNWSNGIINKSISNVAAGTYTVTVTDKNGASSTAQATINEPTDLVLTTSGTDVTINGISDGTASANVGGGTPLYTYLWSNGSTTATIDNLSVGAYTVTVTDGNNCQEIDAVAIGEPDAVVVALIDVDVLCYGENTGSASTTVSGGVGSYAYVWSNGSSSSSISSVSAGIYTVTVSDDNGATATASTEITEPSELTASVEDAALACFGDDNGELTVVANGGTTDYSYVWSNGDATAAITGLTAGTYTVTVTDANNCSTTATATVSEPSELTASVEDAALACFGDDNGELTATAQGGTTDYSYVWSNGDATAAITGLTAGTYTVTVTDANNCSTTATATVTEPSELTASVEDAELACFGDDNGELTATAQGGTTDYSYVWSNGDATAAITGLTAGTYTVTVTDANNCSTTATATVSEPSELTASVEDAELACFGDDNGELTATAQGGTTDYSYVWSNGDATAAITGLTAGTYTVTVTDANNCSTTATATVSEPSELTASAEDAELACFGDDNGELTATAQGGTTDYSYVWSNGDATAAITGLTAGTYTVTVTDANNCSTTATATVSEPSELTASVEDAELACFGDDNGGLQQHKAAQPITAMFGQMAMQQQQLQA